MTTSDAVDSKYDNDRSTNTSSIHTVSGNEIITIGVGGCGLNMLNEYFSTIMNEHKINKNGIFEGNLSLKSDQLLFDKNNTFFRYRSESKKYIPRSLFFDIDKSSIDSIKSSFLGLLVDDENFIYSDCGMQGILNWAKGHYTDGAELIDDIMECIRNEAEICEYLQGFNIFHSICGGVGGGLGTLILLKIRDEYIKKQQFTYSVFPSKNGYHGNINNNFEIYNSVLSIFQLIENTDLTFHIDNGKILEICNKKCGLTHPTFNDMNWIISLILSGVTSSFRFCTEPTLIGNMQRMNNYHISFEKLHFLTLCNTPYFGIKQYKLNDNNNIDGIINDILDIDNVSGVNLENGKILSCSICYRCDDNKGSDKMSKYIENFGNKFGDDFVEWVPNPFASCYILDGNNQYYNKYTSLFVSSVVNTTSIRNVYQSILRDYNKNYQRKAFLHFYKGEGMDEMEFNEASNALKRIAEQYKDKEDITVHSK